MTGGTKSFFLLLITILLIGLFYGQTLVVKNQKLQMKQQFHSDLIALVSLLGEDGLKKLHSAKTSKELTSEEVFATGVLLQRFLVAYKMKDVWTAEEWKYIKKDVKAAMNGSELLRSRWEQIRSWYPKNDQEFLDKIFFDVMSEAEKKQSLQYENEFKNGDIFKEDSLK